MKQELKAYTYDDMLDGDADIDVEYYLKDEVDAVLAEKDKVIAELKNGIAPNRSDKTLQERVNAICEKHGVSTLQDLDWAFCESEKRRTRDCIEAAEAIRHNKYKRCVVNAWWCRKLSKTYALSAYTHRGWKIDRYYDKKAELYRKWHKRWLELAEKFKEA